MFSLASCKKESIKSDEVFGNLEFSFSSNTQKSASNINSLADESSLSTLVIAIEDENGNLVKNYEKIELFNLNGYYISKPVSLLVGNYKLTQFMVLDQNDSIVYLSPMQNSPKAYLVTNPLPLEFSISKDITNKIVPEVLSTKDSKPEDFGYTTFAFDVVETFDFLIGTFIYNESITNYELTTANIQIFADSLLVYSGDLGNQITDSSALNNGKTNQITLPERYNYYTLKVAKQGFYTYEKTFTKEELKLHFLSSDKGPLIVILEVAEQGDGLVAFYPFNGNANDESGNENNGTVHGASLTEDRFGNSNSAYYLDGISNYISILNSSTLNPQNAFTLCAWYKSYDFTGAGYSPIIDKGYYSHTAPYYQYKLGVCGNYSTNYLYNMNFSVTTNNVENRARSNKNYWTPGNWYFLVGTYDGTNVQLYIDNQLIQSVPATGLINNYDTPIYFGNNTTADDFLKGVIDDIRIYNRALSEGEIKVLYDLGK
jgi:hypothetical protein